MPGALAAALMMMTICRCSALVSAAITKNAPTPNHITCNNYLHVAIVTENDVIGSLLRKSYLPSTFVDFNRSLLYLLFINPRESIV